MPIDPESLKIPVDLERSEIITRYHLRVVLQDGRSIDVYQDGDRIAATQNGRNVWRYENPQSGSVFNGLCFDRYDPTANKISSYIQRPTGYIAAMLKSIETDGDSHDLNRGCGFILDPLTGKQVGAFGPSW